jgi:dipeptidyl aminopeptidase/acylaminoacyl peptidase
VRIDLATNQSTVVAENARSDIFSVEIGQDTHEPVAYSVILARRENKALRPEFQSDFEFLNSQNLGDWSLDSRSEDERYWKLTTLTDFRMGAALYDRNARTITKLYDTRSRLSGAPLAHMYPVTIKSRDGLDLVSYLSLPRTVDSRQVGVPDAPAPLVLVVHGGPWLRDTFGFNEVHQWLANRGYAALSVNFRASQGFGKAFVNAGNGEWGGKISDDLLDAVNWAIRNKIADPKRIAIMGASFGGYSTLIGMTRDSDIYACGFDIVGISDLESFVTTMPPYWETFRPLVLQGAGDPGTEEGRALLRARSPLHQADRISKPLLVAHGDNDARVNRAASDRIVAAVKANRVPITYLSYPDEGHFIQRPENNLSMYAVAEQFFAKCLGGRAEPITINSLKGSSIRVLEGAEHIDGLQAALSAVAGNIQ